MYAKLLLGTFLLMHVSGKLTSCIIYSCFVLYIYFPLLNNSLVFGCTLFYPLFQLDYFREISKYLILPDKIIIYNTLSSTCLPQTAKSI